MTTNFALSLSFEGIQLLHRVTGGWRLVGEADVEADDLDAALADLRKKALALEPGGLRTKLVIPLDQIKYMALDTTQTDDDDIRHAIDGTTPYSLDELVIDCERRGGRTHIAAVARETLQEAESFARAHRFNPVCFVAIPDPFTFQSEIFFGSTATMSDVLGMGATVERDILPIMIVGTRVRSRLLIFDIPEEELPQTEEPDLATLLAPHIDPPEAPKLEEPVPADNPVAVEVEAAQEAAPVEDPIAVEPADDLVTEEQIAESEPEIITPDAPVEETPSRQDEDDTQEDAPIETPAAVAEQVVTEPPEDPIVAETVPAALEPEVVAAAPEDTIAENAPKTIVERADQTTAPVPAPATVAVAPATRAPAFPMPVDPIIGEYHTARPKYKRRARRRVVGTLTQVVPAPEGMAKIAAAASGPVAPVAPIRNRPTAPAKPGLSRKVLLGTAIAASFALAGLLAWMQFGADTPAGAEDIPGDPAAQAAPADTATLPQTDQASPTVAMLEPRPEPTPSVSDLVLDLPSPLPAAPAGRPAPALVAGAPDAVLPEIAPMPAAPEQDVAQAEPGAPVLRGRVLSPDEAADIYAATGVWQRAPRIIDVPQTTQAERILLPQIASVPEKLAQPIVPDADVLEPELTFVAPADPPPPEVAFEIADDGFVAATPEGAVTPDGAVVFAGLPDLTVRARPTLTQDDLDRMSTLAPAPEGVVIIAGPPPVTPPLRPANAGLPAVADTADTEAETATAGAVSLAGLNPEADDDALTDEASAGGTTLAGLRPRPRPSALAPTAPPADLPSNPDITSVIAGIAQEEASTPFIDMTPRAVGASRRPETRPRNFATVVANARQRLQQQTTTAAATPAPRQPAAAAPAPAPRNTGPTPGGVARAATQDDAIRLRDINLIGVYGRPNNRRALVRLSNGTFVRVEIGSSLDGGQVTAIGDNALNYVKRGRTYALQVPNS